MTKLRKNLAEEYLRYLTERDARKILIADLNELRYQREDMSLAQSPGELEPGGSLALRDWGMGKAAFHCPSTYSIPSLFRPQLFGNFLCHHLATKLGRNTANGLGHLDCQGQSV